MRKLLCALIASAALLSAQSKQPRHVFNPNGRLTAPSSRPARAIADDYLRSTALDAGFSPGDLAGLEVVKQYRTQHNGVTHLVYQQRFQGVGVYNSEWTVNIGPDGAIINAGGSLAPAPATGVTPPQAPSVMRAIRSAAAAVNPRVAQRFVPFQTSATDPSNRQPAHFAALDFSGDIQALPVWYAANGALRAAWLFYVPDDDNVNGYEVVIDDATQATLSKQNLTWFDQQGLVFDHSSPQPNPTPGLPFTGAPPIIPRTMQSFAGDPQASPPGWVSGTQTAGNNVIVGLDRLGTRFVMPTLTDSSGGVFEFPLQVGAGAPVPTTFPDAASVNLFYWVNRAHDFYYSLGFDEAAGNYQKDNFGKGGIDGDPLFVYSQYGAAGPGGASLNNAFYTTQRSGEDGAPSMLAFYLASSTSLHGFVDLSYDPEVIVHEYTHGVSTRLIRQLGSTFHGGAMGEAFSDFMAMELTLPNGGPVDGSYPTGTYFAQDWTRGIRTHPYSTDLAINPLTFGKMGTVSTGPEVHADGEIWVEALWEVRAAMIRQFGEAEGRRRLRLLMIDAMELAPPAPSMVDMRDTILLAERVDFNGDSQSQLWQAFARRGLGVLAAAPTGNSIHVVESTDVPSAAPVLRFYDNSITLGEPVRLVLYDPQATGRNARIHLTTTYGDSEDIFLDRTGSAYTGTLTTTEFSTVLSGNNQLEVVPGDTITATYAGSSQPVQATTSAKPRYFFVQSTPVTFQFTNETPMNLIGQGVSSRVTLPFPFPYYDKTYSSVWVFSNGLLSFTGQVTSTCSDTADFMMHSGIAPLWLSGLRTIGSAQPNEDVYRSTGTDSITFRWAAEGVMVSGTTEPVNFSTTLFKDGRIEFHYGSGNHNLVGNSCSGPTAPVTGLANGHETYTQSAAHSNQIDLQNAFNVLLFPPFGSAADPAGVLESPAAGDHVTGPFTVKGYRYDPNQATSLTFIYRLDLLIDGVSVSHSPTNQQRPDICSGSTPPGCPTIGYSFAVNPDALGLAPGPHTLQLLVTNSRGASTKVPADPLPFTLDPGPPQPPAGLIESLKDGDSITGTVAVKGYAWAPTLRVLGVDLLIDGITYGATAYGGDRSDICATVAAGSPNCPNIGFTVSLNTKSTSLPLSLGPHQLWMRARDELGKYTSFPDAPLNITVK